MTIEIEKRTEVTLSLTPNTTLEDVQDFVAVAEDQFPTERVVVGVRGGEHSVHLVALVQETVDA